MVGSMERWNGKIAVVTGASAGIGADVAKRLVEEGLQVVGFARRSERIEELAKTLKDKKGKLHAVKVDMMEEEDILKGFQWVVDNLGPISILINNAGLAQLSTLLEGTTEQWKVVLDTNVLGLCIATREAVKSMKANKIDGHVIHINSVVGHTVPAMSGLSVYPASKFAVTALTETLRQELLHQGLKIKITSISPGGTDTEFMEAANFTKNPKFEELRKTYSFLAAEDITDSIIYALGTPPHVQVHELTIQPLR